MIRYIGNVRGIMNQETPAQLLDACVDSETGSVDSDFVSTSYVRGKDARSERQKYKNNLGRISDKIKNQKNRAVK